MDKLSKPNKPENREGVINNESPNKFLRLRIILIVTITVLIGVILIKILSPKIQILYADYLLSRVEKWPVAFSAVFDDEIFSNWQPTDGVIEESITRFTASSGHLEIVFAPTKETTVRDAFFSQQATAPEDFLLTMKINPPVSCHSGPIFRGNLKGEYYLFLVADDAYTVEILPRDSHGDLPREAIIQNKEIPEDIGQPYDLNVLAYNNSYYFFINRIFVDKMRDTRLQGDQVGIELFVCQGVTAESLFQVDGFSLRKPNEASASAR